MALNTLQLIDDCDIVAAHVFPFSPRANTPAARMPQVEREIVKARAARLRAKAAERRSAWLQSLVGTTQRVLVELGGKGHTDGFAPVRIALLRGQSLFPDLPLPDHVVDPAVLGDPLDAFDPDDPANSLPA